MKNDIEKLKKKIRKQQICIYVLVSLVSIIAWITLRYFGLDPITNTKFPLLDPLREFTSPESYVINIQNLRGYLTDIGNKYPDSVSIYYENINSGANITVNRDLRIFPASLSKLVQAILIAQKVEKGELVWNQKLEVIQNDLSMDSGTLYQRGVGYYSVEELLKELLVNSDNTAQNVFRRYLTVPEYISFQDETGLQDLYNDKGLISAKEYTRILRVLYTSSFLIPEHSEKILKYMSQAVFGEYLSQGIPDGVTFAHKYGENKQYIIFADSGIVYVPGKPYMITVLIKGKDSTEETRQWAMNLMKEISERAYQVSK